MPVPVRRVTPPMSKNVRAELAALDRAATAHKPLRYGSRGPGVVALQRHLLALGLYRGSANGIFGAKTRAGVIALQKGRGLAATGTVGPKDAAAVRAQDLFVKPGFGTVARSGQVGGDVKDMENRLKALGFNPGAVDGRYDASTTSAVRRFQQKMGLAVSGSIGPATARRIASERTEQLTAAKGPAFLARAVRLARTQVGVRETPMGSNRNKYSPTFGRPPEPWCADFVSWVYTRSGRKLNIAYTPTLLQRFKDNGSYHRSSPKPGEIVIFDWTPRSGGLAEHTGIVERVFTRGGRTWIQTIEGNYGDRVQRRQIAVSDPRIRGFGT